MMEDTAASYLEDLFLANDLVCTNDFEVVSFLAIDQDKKVQSADAYFQFDSTDLLRFRNAKQALGYLQEQQNIYITPTPMKNEKNRVYFYKLDVEIDIDLAITTGLGVVRMLTGIHQGEYLLYAMDQVYNETPEKIDNLVEEWVRIKIYTQIIHGNTYLDKALKDKWLKDRSYLTCLLIGETDQVEKRLAALYGDG